VLRACVSQVLGTNTRLHHTNALRTLGRLLAQSETLSRNKTFLSSCHQSIHKLRSLFLLKTYGATSRRRQKTKLNAERRRRVLPTLDQDGLCAVSLVIIYEPIIVDLYGQDRSVLVGCKT